MTRAQDTKAIGKKKTYISPQVQIVALDHEISMVMMSGNISPPGEGGIPTQDPLMSLKGFRLFR